MRERDYERMPPTEVTLASYLSMGETSSLKVPSLPSKPLQDTSCINGKAYAAAGQAVGSLHTMAVLQAYQADLLKDLDKCQALSLDKVAELRRTTDEASYEVSVGTSLIFRLFRSALQSPYLRVLLFRTVKPLTVSCPEGPPVVSSDLIELYLDCTVYPFRVVSR